MGRVKDYLERAETRKNVTQANKRARPLSYARYYEDYEERTVLSTDGKIHRSEQVYVGTYHRAQLPDGGWQKRKVVYALLTAPCLFFLFFPAMQSLAYNYVRYVALGEGFSLFFALFFLWHFFPRMFAPDKLTNREYREVSVRFSALALALALSGVYTAAAAVVHCLLTTPMDSRELFAAASFLAGAGCAFGIYRLEKQLPYEKIPPANGGEI